MSSSWLERHEALRAQAEDLANGARREAESATTTSAQGRGGMQSLAARRKLMEMSRVIASMEKLSQDNLCATVTVHASGLCLMSVPCPAAAAGMGHGPLRLH